MALGAVVFWHGAGLPARVVVVGLLPAVGVDGLLRAHVEEGLGKEGLVQALRVGSLGVAKAPDRLSDNATEHQTVNAALLGHQGLEVNDLLVVEQQAIATLLQVYLEDGLMLLPVTQVLAGHDLAIHQLQRATTADAAFQPQVVGLLVKGKRPTPSPSL